MAHVAKWKFKQVEELTNLLTNKPVIGIVEIGGIPAPQIQKMRKNLKNIAELKSSKNSLILRAFDEAEKKVKGIADLKEHVTGQTAILATDINPFKIFNKIKTTRTNAPAKGGETASLDIEVKAGATSFKPGPIVGELQKVGIPAAIQEGKVVIKKDKVIVKAGEKIPRDVAQMLTRLEIFPIEIGMSIHGIFEKGMLYKPDVLDIDMDEFLIDIQKASNNAFNLAIKTAWINKQTIKPLLNKAFIDAYTLAIDRGIINKKTIKDLISKAHNSMISLASKSKDGLDDDLKNMLT
jgi:large subunit ribosomal protein L10